MPWEDDTIPTEGEPAMGGKLWQPLETDKSEVLFTGDCGATPETLPYGGGGGMEDTDCWALMLPTWDKVDGKLV